ncbi:MAG: hypothetical protein IPL61_32750 [Myxococcales bacterium]|nr:hypothetical protein [Myxococcales bacterium]
MVVGLVLMGMMALGAAVAPAPRTVGRTDATPPLAQPAPWGARVAFTLGALVAGALIVWLPYAWTRVIAAGGWHVALIGVVVFYRLVTPVARWILGRRVWRRRFGLLALAVVLLGAYVVVPIVAMPARADLRPPPALALLLTAYFGAYFTCLVFGWYLLLCLQWNGHGNEAGGAARVVDYAEFVRIKLTRDRAEVWVIAAADRGPDAPPPRPSWWTRTRAWMSMRLPPPHDHVGTATLVDHFTIERPPSTTSTPPAAPAAPPPA